MLKVFEKSVLLLFFCFIFYSCGYSGKESNTIENESKKTFYSAKFKEAQSKNKLVEIVLDSFENYSDLRKEMGKHSCKGKTSGLVFNFDSTTYHVTGFSICPSNHSTACYFTPNQLFVKNDSLYIWRYGYKAKPINFITSQLDTIVSKKTSYYFENNKRLRNVIIHLFVEDKYPMIKTKKILKEIEESLSRIIKREDLKPFKYSILFESFSLVDLSPHPAHKP